MQEDQKFKASYEKCQVIDKTKQKLKKKKKEKKEKKEKQAKKKKQAKNV